MVPHVEGAPVPLTGEDTDMGPLPPEEEEGATPHEGGSGDKIVINGIIHQGQLKFVFLN